MRAHTMLWMAAFAVAGCAVFEKTGGKSRQDEFRAQFASAATATLCTASPCIVKITVAANCVATVDPEVLGVDTSLVDAKVKWQIQPASSNQATFVRARHGINPKQGSVIGWRLEFLNPQHVGDTEFTWDDRNRVAGGARQRRHDYEIEMVQNGRRCHVDPTIINDY